MAVTSRAAMSSRNSQTNKLVNHIDRLARQNPQQAQFEAELVEDPSMRATALITLGKRVRRVEPLADARSIVLGLDSLNSGTRNDKLAQISFAAVGLDNTFSTETARETRGPIYCVQLANVLSEALTPSIKDKLDSGDYLDFNNYPDMVMGAFHASVGNSTYFGDVGEYNYVRVPTSLRLTPRIVSLDPIRDGGRALDAFRDNPPYLSELLEFIGANSLAANLQR